MRLLALTLVILAGSASAQAADPLSAIDWLSQSVVTLPAQQTAPSKPKITEPPVSATATSPSVRVTSLDAPSADPIGLLPTNITGLPRDLWAGSLATDVATLMSGQRVDGIPAAQSLLRMIILAEADAPITPDAESTLFLARIDKLLDIGALDPALEMLNLTEAKTPPIFRRWFDVALLTGTEDDACTYMRDTPSTAPTSTTRIFCLARNGDWPAAALTLNTHVALGDISDDDADLLARFLDPDLFEDEAALPPPNRVSPLVFRIREAIGEAVPTRSLPQAFSHADLRNTVGWKSQLEAAERLTRSGAISPSTLQGLYLARTPAASGGIWDRVDAIQRLDTAIKARSSNAIHRALPDAWAAIKSARTEVAFANIYGPAMTLLEAPEEIAVTLALLSPDYEVFTQAQEKQTFLTSLALGSPTVGTTELETSIAAAFLVPTPDPSLVALAEDGKLGEALLQSLASFNVAHNDMQAITEVLSFWRSIGLEDLTRRAALQLLLLERRS